MLVTAVAAGEETEVVPQWDMSVYPSGLVVSRGDSGMTLRSLQEVKVTADRRSAPVPEPVYVVAVGPGRSKRHRLPVFYAMVECGDPRYVERIAVARICGVKAQVPQDEKVRSRLMEYLNSTPV